MLEILDGMPIEEVDVVTKEENFVPYGKFEQIIVKAESQTFTMRELLNKLKNKETGEAE